ncbi:phytanoyl-CoA dioxygenase family protein [Glaciimonas immobilis]|uniref:Phytanoyl-CoA hydroxylase n=1 Tax=Glaciimonas immobilis TaxID=728004 RepID=A0A840RWY5_9BURK|nr:phytanoyl-CoA dioxygenase family protein [Glaciimonas immobilis]KAF3998716.1 phytanoyl-CoA dioxygenase family protein [Glaciimonas immobilis]MBB5201598.1 phytanoyl-CoA hydroxylase [Glaciimonas immobilis]
MNSNNPLSAQQIAAFETDGFLILPRMVSAADCAYMATVTNQHLRDAVAPLEYESEVGYSGAPKSIDSVGGRTARRLRDAYHRDASFRQWAVNPTLVAMLAQLMGEQVCLTLAHHNCVMTKHPDYGTATGWHRDIRYWSFVQNALISVWLALDTETENNGGLRLIPGSHRFDIQPSQMDGLDFLRPDVADNQALFAQGIPLHLNSGDVVFFHSGLFHAAGRNNSQAVKESVVYAYHGISNPPVPGSRSATAEDIVLSSNQGD